MSVTSPKSSITRQPDQVDDLTSADPLLNPDDLFDVPHGMDIDDLAVDFFVPEHAIAAAVHAVMTTTSKSCTATPLTTLLSLR